MISCVNFCEQLSDGELAVDSNTLLRFIGIVNH